MTERVVVLGAGYAGLLVTRSLEDHLPADVDLQIVDESGEHLIQHELHRVIRRPSLADHLRVPLADVLERATIHTGTVSEVDPTAHRVEFVDERPAMDYDVGVIALGADPADHDIPGVVDHGTPLKRLHHAKTIRERFLAVAEDDGRVIVGGGGLAGVQVAGELAALARERDAEVDIALFEQESTLAPDFPREFRIAVERELRTRGVTVRTDARITGASPDTVSVENGDPVPYDQLVWTGGIRGVTAMGAERPRVQSTLLLPADPDRRTLVVGDAAEVVDDEGRAVTASAQAAIREAKVAARNVETIIDGGTEGFEPRLERFRFEHSGWLVSVGDGAVAQIGPTIFTGAAAKALKSSVGARYLASAGAIQEAVALVREEFRDGQPVRERDPTPPPEGD